MSAYINIKVILYSVFENCSQHILEPKKKWKGTKKEENKERQNKKDNKKEEKE